jgi:hypothetical protein
MSKWNHNICLTCWDQLNPTRTPHRLREQYAESEKCCYCGRLNRDGIYVRENPESKELLCKGVHAE